MDRSSREERILQLLTESQKRAIISILAEAAQHHVSELAKRLVSRNASVLRSSEYEDELESILISLHHNHLPKLAEIGLVEYDQAENIVTYQGIQSNNTNWLDVEQVEELLIQIQGKNGIDEFNIGMVEGRENVIDRGRQLIDEADEELFLKIVSADLLGDECFSHVQNAIERGVDIYLGSQNPKVRELTRREVPDVTVWEPQLDWLNTPMRYPKVGRLVFADREKVMLAILDESALDGTTTETAVTSEGETNPLIVLVRELLGPRLDHLDFQSEDFRHKFPFEL